VKCGAKGKIKCSKCDDGYQPCYFCASTGLINKKRLFGSYSAPCPECKGSKKIRCLHCEGKGSAICSECKGTGRKYSCLSCLGTGRIKCSDCFGKGKIESQWLKSIKYYSSDKLNIEIDKRKHEIDRLKYKKSQLIGDLSELEDYADSIKNEPWVVGHRGALPIGLDSIPGEISIIENQIEELDDEIDAIYEALGAKK
jgi:hypothetical protein